MKNISNCRERIDLVDRFIRLLGTNCIDCSMADREFVVDDWVKFLNNGYNNIRYYVRISNNFKIIIPDKNKKIKVSCLFNSLKNQEFLHYDQIIRTCSQLCYDSGCKVHCKDIGTAFFIIE